MQTVVVNGEKRVETGKRGTKVVRNEEKIPCVLYGDGRATHFSTTIKDIRSLVYTPDFKLAEVEIDGKTHRSILKDVQFHPVTEKILHIDFLELIPGNSIKVEIPLRFKGSSPGVRAGGKLLQKVRRVKIKTTPENLVDEVYADISGMELGQSIRVRDIQLNEGVEIMNSPGIPVATIEIPRALKSATAAAQKEGGK